MTDFSYRIQFNIANPFWSDTDPVECKHETPVPARLDKVVFKVGGAVIIDWFRIEFRRLLADDVEETGNGRRHRMRQMRAERLNADLTADLTDNSLAVYSVRGRRGQNGEFRGLRDSTPPRLYIYQLGLLTNAVHRHWRINAPVRDSYDDLDRDPSTRRPLKQELIVWTFQPSDVTEIMSESIKRAGKRLVPRSAE